MLLQMALFHSFLWLSSLYVAFPGGASGKKPACLSVQETGEMLV